MKILLRFAAFFLFALTISDCKNNRQEEKPELQRAKKVLLAWNEQILDLERHTSGYRPPVSTRMFAYAQICAYEVSVPFMPNYNSLTKSILPKNISVETPPSYDLAIALNAAYAEISRYFFAAAPPEQAEKLAQKEEALLEEMKTRNDDDMKAISIDFGKKIAKAIWNYAKTDSIAHEADLYNYDKDFMPVHCKGCWQPCGEHPMPALLPHWGQTRTFVVHKKEVAVLPPLAFDETHNSSFYTEAMEVFLTAQNRTYEDIWIAEFWSDDLPGLTVSPAGRWFSISNQFVHNKDNFSFSSVMESYLKLGLALNDASVICWNAKYQYNVERPESYIHRNISPNWRPLHDSPSFPSYPSGHSIFGATAVEVLKAHLGNTSNFTDLTHKSRPEFRGKPRTYTSFDEMAKENAFSRLSMGVHYRMDCEEGFRIGKMIGLRVAQVQLKTAVK